MAGHSHFKNMMHRKGRADKIRSKLFTKISREITVSAKLGTPDPEMNPRLRAAVQLARALEYIEKLIKPGVKTDFIDQAANKYLSDHGAFSAPE